MITIAIPLYIPIISRNSIPGIKLLTSDKFEYILDDIDITIINKTNKNEYDFIPSKIEKINNMIVFNHPVINPSSQSLCLIGDSPVACLSKSSYVVELE